jgi:hypothetical protein
MSLVLMPCLLVLLLVVLHPLVLGCHAPCPLPHGAYSMLQSHAPLLLGVSVYATAQQAPHAASQRLDQQLSWPPTQGLLLASKH